MQITITFSPGFDVEGVVLSITASPLRVALQNWDDAAEFQYRDGEWFSENQDPVWITWPQSSDGAGNESLTRSSLCDRTSLQSSIWLN